jgi:hypothetical protein
MTEDARPTVGAPTWTPLSWPERLTILAAVALIAAITIPRLPPGVCFGDSGDLQLASATLGIAHPPGYGLLASLGWMATWVPGIEPAYAVSLLCLACGVGAVALGMVLMVRLGAAAALAAALGVLATAHPRIWSNLLAPEVYAPGLLFLAAATYLLVGYAHDGKRGRMVWAGLCLGATIATRPPVVVALPFVVAGVWISDRRLGRNVAWRIRSLAAGAACTAVPILYQAGYTWIRDVPEAPYNYIEQYNAEAGILPSAGEGPGAKFERLAWLARGTQFRDMMGYKRSWFRGQLAAIDREVTLQWLDLHLPTVSLLRRAAVWGVLALGLVVLARRCVPAMIFLLGVALQSAVFVSLYRVSGGAADMLPLLWVAMALMGIALAPVLGGNKPRWSGAVGLVLLLVSCLWTVLDAPSRVNAGRSQDATRFAAKADLATFPDDAVICSSWDTSLPLWYAQKVVTQRDDLRIINAASVNWLGLVEPYPDRPVYFAAPIPVPAGFELVPYRQFWQLQREKR